MMTTKIHEEGEEEKPNPEGDAVDRMSEVPVEILHHILGFLEMDKFLIQTSLVSTKWRNLWKSVSTLRFSYFYTILNNATNVLRLRDSKIQIFNYCCYYVLLERLHNFIVSAVNQGVQEIQIICYCFDDNYNNNNNNNGVHFNPSIFTTGRALRKFTFHSDFLIQFPRSMCSATQLTHLSLGGIRLPEVGDESNGELHLASPVLETLVMRNCYCEHLKVLDISAPRLNKLLISNIYVRVRGFDGLGGCRIEIRTPNLTSLDYYGSVYVDCFTENLPRLAFASLCFTMETGKVEKTTSFAIKLLKGLTSAKTLILKEFEVFSQDTLRDLLTPFTSLTTLKMKTHCNIVSSIHGIVHFLNSCNSIMKFVWRVDKTCTVEGDDEDLMLPQCKLSHLKHVHIERLHGHKYEIELVKFLLKNSVVLEDIIINTASDSPKRSIEENLKQFIEEEPSVRRSIKLHILSFRRNEPS